VAIFTREGSLNQRQAIEIQTQNSVHSPARRDEWGFVQLGQLSPTPVNLGELLTYTPPNIELGPRHCLERRAANRVSAATPFACLRIGHVRGPIRLSDLNILGHFALVASNRSDIYILFLRNLYRATIQVAFACMQLHEIGNQRDFKSDTAI
jgi:hypothetical protein